MHEANVWAAKHWIKLAAHFAEFKTLNKILELNKITKIHTVCGVLWLAVANVRWQFYRMKYYRRSCCPEFQTLCLCWHIKQWTKSRFWFQKSQRKNQEERIVCKVGCGPNGDTKPFAKVQLQHMAQRVNYIAAKFFKLHMHSHFKSTYSYLSNVSLLFIQRSEEGRMGAHKKSLAMTESDCRYRRIKCMLLMLKRPSFYFEVFKHS